jgi:Insertion element 4 transposase N-terminal/Transposase DDE domain
MEFQVELSQTLSKTPACLDGLSELIDPSWIHQALAATGKASIRRRRLPAEHVVWLVIGLALFRNQPIWHVVRQLDLVLDTPKPVCAPSAAIQARQRLGDEPLANLFKQLTQAWGAQRDAQDAGLNGLRVLAVDGVVWSAPDTPENREGLGCCANQHGAGSWPQLRAVCLMDTHSHELMDAQLGAMTQGELTLAASLQVPDESITVFDRAYFSAAFLLDWQGQGKDRHWLMRAKDNLRHEIIATHGPGDYTIRMPVSQQARKLAPELPLWWQARLIEVQLGARTRRFITSLGDAKRYPVQQLAALYCQRWEIELGFREIKQSLQANNFVLRSKQPGLVRQEIWGVLIAYTLLRRQMRLMAQHLKVPPVRIGFHVACIAIIELLRFAPLESAATLPKRLSLLYEQAHIFLLPPRRSRSCPRVVKHRPSKYPRKMPVSS